MRRLAHPLIGDGRTRGASKLTPSTLCVMNLVILMSMSGLIQPDAAVVRASVSSDAMQANNPSHCDFSNLSENGRVVEFRSGASNLVPDDTNGLDDVFVHDVSTSTTGRVNVSSDGEQANDDTFSATLSGNGRYVAFSSKATNLAPDANAWEDVFVHDRATATTELVDVSSSGVQANDISYWPGISATGRYVAFVSLADNLVPGVGNGQFQIFRRDRVAGTTLLVSAGSTGGPGNDDSYAPTVSANGRYVAFYSVADDLVPADTNGEPDTFLTDMLTGLTRRVSVSSTGTQGNGQSLHPHMSINGRYVAFTSYASNLVPGDTNRVADAFLRDSVLGTTVRVSVSSNAMQANANAEALSISPDGGYVGVFSQANNLVPHDTNHAGDMFVANVSAGTLTRVSLSGAGRQANGVSLTCGLSTLARFVAFDSAATNLIRNDTNGFDDIFLRGPLSFASPAPRNDQELWDGIS